MAITLDPGTGSKTKPKITTPKIVSVPVPTITQHPSTTSPGDFVFQEPNLTWGYIPPQPAPYIPPTSQQAKVGTGYGQMIPSSHPQAQAAKVGTGYGEPIYQQGGRFFEPVENIGRRRSEYPVAQYIQEENKRYGEAGQFLGAIMNPRRNPYLLPYYFNQVMTDIWNLPTTLFPQQAARLQQKLAASGTPYGGYPPVSFGGEMDRSGYGPFIDLGYYDLPLGEISPIEREEEELVYNPPPYTSGTGDGRQVVRIGSGTPGSYYRSTGSHLINWRI